MVMLGMGIYGTLNFLSPKIAAKIELDRVFIRDREFNDPFGVKYNRCHSNYLWVKINESNRFNCYWCHTDARLYH